MLWNALDLGATSNPWLKPTAGQIRGEVAVEGAEAIAFPRGSILREIDTEFWVRAWQGIGGQAALSFGAARYFLKQLEEFASNRFYSPTLIQWTTTADPTGYSAVDPHDGWWEIDHFAPDYSSFIPSGYVKCHLKTTFVAPPAPRSMAMAYSGGALASTFLGTANLMLALPKNSTTLEPANIAINGGEGQIVCPFPVASQAAFVPSATTADIFKGGCHVYDTINTGTNPVPTAGGTFINANWVEVFGTDHVFVGDCVITNGLLLIVLVVGQNLTGYLWNTALATPTWQNVVTVTASDNGFSGCPIRSYSLVRVGSTEAAVAIKLASSAALYDLGLRLQAGRYDCRLEVVPLTQVNNNGFQLELTTASYKIAYSPAGARDAVIESNTGVPADTTYGFGAFFGTTAGLPIVGFLYQNIPQGPNVGQPFITGGPTTIALGDAVPVLKGRRIYGFFAVPFGVSGGYSTANLQAEAESGSLAGGWVSVVDAAASNGHAAKLPSGTALGANETNASWVPPAGNYRCAVRVKVASAASGVAQMTLGLFNVTAGAFSAASQAGLAPSGFTTGYLWYLLGGVVNANGTDLFEFDSFSTAATTTDWFIDEYALLPLALPANSTGPQDIWQHFMYDRDVEMIVL